MKLNFNKLRQDMHCIANEIRFIRANGGSPTAIKCELAYQDWVKSGHSRNSDEWDVYLALSKQLWDHSLVGLKEKATALCSIRANHHGRLHLTKVRNPYSTMPNQPPYLFPGKLEQDKIVAKYIKEYEQEDIPAQK